MRNDCVTPPSIRAVCTWGDGPDVLLVMVSHLGEKSWWDLRVDEARQLITELEQAVWECDRCDASVEEYFAEEEKRNKALSSRSQDFTPSK